MAGPLTQLRPTSTITSQEPTKLLTTSPEPNARASQQFLTLESDVLHLICVGVFMTVSSVLIHGVSGRNPVGVFGVPAP